MAHSAIDWDTVFYRYAGQPANERSITELAKVLRVSVSTVKRHAERDHWKQRLADIDRMAHERRTQNAVRTLSDRLDDDIRIVEAMRHRFAQRLRDPSYQPTAHEFFAMARLELLIEGRDTHRIGVGSVSEEFKDALRRLPVYVRERIIMSHMTGIPIEEVMELEPVLDGELVDDDGPID